MIDSYGWRGGREALLRFGPDTGPVVIAAMPLFEEANRTRAFMVTVLRALAEHGIRSALPDLPGTGESLVEPETVSLGDWRAAFAAAVDEARGEDDAYAIGLRGGTLLDTEADVAARWHFAPAAGASLVRELYRTRIAGDHEDGRTTTQDMLDMESENGSITLAGNRISGVMIAALRTAEPAFARTVRLETDARPADLKLPGSPLWRRAEPGNDGALADLLADDIARWIATCAA